jgi:hypothetical protein
MESNYDILLAKTAEASIEEEDDGELEAEIWTNNLENRITNEAEQVVDLGGDTIGS